MIRPQISTTQETGEKTKINIPRLGVFSFLWRPFYTQTHSSSRDKRTHSQITCLQGCIQDDIAPSHPSGRSTAGTLCTFFGNCWVTQIRPEKVSLHDNNTQFVTTFCRRHFWIFHVQQQGFALKTSASKRKLISGHRYLYYYQFQSYSYISVYEGVLIRYQ